MKGYKYENSRGQITLHLIKHRDKIRSRIVKRQYYLPTVTNVDWPLITNISTVQIQKNGPKNYIQDSLEHTLTLYAKPSRDDNI